MTRSDRSTAPGRILDEVSDVELHGYTIAQVRQVMAVCKLTPRQGDILTLLLTDIRPEVIAVRLGLRASYVRTSQWRLAQRLRTRDGVAGIRKQVAELTEFDFA